jgi:hypothetical protein
MPRVGDRSRGEIKMPSVFSGFFLNSPGGILVPLGSPERQERNIALGLIQAILHFGLVLSYSVGGTARNCRHCFECLTGCVNVITLLGNDEDCRELRIRKGTSWNMATRNHGLGVTSHPLGA